MTPSHLVGLKRGSYEAYCLDQAVGYFGAVLQSELEKAGRKPGKEERRAEKARERVLQRFLGMEDVEKFADPAAFFS